MHGAPQHIPTHDPPPPSNFKVEFRYTNTRSTQATLKLGSGRGGRSGGGRKRGLARARSSGQHLAYTFPDNSSHLWTHPRVVSSWKLWPWETGNLRLVTTRILEQPPDDGPDASTHRPFPLYMFVPRNDALKEGLRFLRGQ